MREGRRRGDWLVEEWLLMIWGGLEMGRGTLSFVEVMFVFVIVFKGHADDVPFLRRWRERMDDDYSAVILQFRRKKHSSFGLRLEESVSREFVPIRSSQDRSMSVKLFLSDIER